MSDPTEASMNPETNEQSETVRFLVDLAKRAGQAILDVKPDELGSYRKGDDAWGDFVTQADLASEQLLLAELAARFPDDEILSEERGGEIDYTKTVWMVDSLDGTKEFKFGGDRFGVMIGRYQDGQPDLGVIWAPAAQTLLWGELGQGSWRQIGTAPAERLRVNQINDLSQARFVVRKPAAANDIRRQLDSFDESLPIKARIPDACIGLKFGRIAANEAEASINTNRKGSKWDTCAPQIILEEAGGMVTDMFGKPLDYTQAKNNWNESFVASNGVLHAKVIALSCQLVDLF